MKMKLSKGIATAFFVSMFLLLLSFSGARAGEIEPKKELPKEESKTKKEIFVDKVIEPNDLFWCGNNALVFYKRDGLFIYDVESRKKTRLDDLYMVPIACTPDGQWFVYKGPDDPAWDTNSQEFGIVNLWRYEFKTGRKQKFLVADKRVQ
jgi:hypothetical protein